MRVIGLAFLLSSLSIVSGSAQSVSLRCKIVEITEITAEGQRVPAPFRNSYSDETLIIDQESGKVFHRDFGNLSYSERLVVDSGSSESSLKIVALSAGGKREGISFRNMSVIQVQTYAAGKKKPFVALKGSVIATGYCQ